MASPSKSTRPLMASILGGAADAAQSAQKRAADAAQLAQKTYESVTPPVWRGDYSPEQWQEWYAASQKPEPSVPGMPQGYESLDSRALHQEWLKRAQPTLVRLFRQFYQANGMRLPQSAVRQVHLSVLGMPHSGDEKTSQLRGQFFDWLRSKTLVGDERSDNSVTPEQLEQWSIPQGDTLPEILGNVPDAMNAHYRLNESGQEQLAALADYNLLTAFQTDPDHRPSFLKSPAMSYIGSTVAKVAEPLTFDTSGISGAITRGLRQGDPRSVLVATLTQDDYSRKRMESDPEYANRVWTGAAVPQFSAASPEGMDFKFNSGNTALGSATRWMTNFLLKQGLTEQQRQDIYDFQRLNQRVTPVRRADADTPLFGNEQARRTAALGRRVSDLEADAWRGVSNYTPRAIYEINDTLGTNIKPFYPPAAVNDALMAVPGMLGDAQNFLSTAATGGFGLLAGGKSGVKNLIQALKGNLYEAPSEAGYNAGLSMADNPGQSWSDYMTKPDKGVTLRTKAGKIPDPTNRQEYEQAVRDLDEQAQKDLMEVRKWLDTQRKPAEAQSPKPAVFSGDYQFLPP